MPNQKSTSSRALAFWLGLTLHLALGVALYHQVTSHPSATSRQSITSEHAADTTAKP